MPRQRQCKKCPWKVSTDPYDIPGGYDPEKHRQLKNTIAPSSATEQLLMLLDKDEPMRIIACHEFKVGHERPCVGSSRGEIRGDYVIDGEQHACIEDTLPK